MVDVTDKDGNRPNCEGCGLPVRDQELVTYTLSRKPQLFWHQACFDNHVKPISYPLWDKRPKEKMP